MHFPTLNGSATSSADDLPRVIEMVNQASNRIHDGEICDRCPTAQAYYRVVFPAGRELLLCAHHCRGHAEALRHQGAVIYDRSGADVTDEKPAFAS